eukprot:2288428-Prorocentrum_lima.AAC.1
MLGALGVSQCSLCLLSLHCELHGVRCEPKGRVRSPPTLRAPPRVLGIECKAGGKGHCNASA